MTIREMMEKKRELGYTNEKLAGLTGIPLPTIQKIFSGKTKAPRQSTIKALEDVLSPTPEGFYRVSKADRLKDSGAAYAVQKKVHTIDEIYALPDGVRAELIDGQIYYMATPTKTHQELAGEMYLEVATYIRAHGGKCKVYIPPFAVYLMGDESTYVEPDLTVVCNPDKLEERGCIGAPDWVVEVLSPSSARVDCLLKLEKYKKAGVQEYWIIDPPSRRVIVYLFAQNLVHFYTFEDKVPCSLFPGLNIRLADV